MIDNIGWKTGKERILFDLTLRKNLRGAWSNHKVSTQTNIEKIFSFNYHFGTSFVLSSSLPKNLKALIIRFLYLWLFKESENINKSHDNETE